MSSRKPQNVLGMSASAHQASSRPAPFVHTRCHTLTRCHLLLPDLPRHEGEAFNPPNCFLFSQFRILLSFPHDDNISCTGGPGASALPSYCTMIARRTAVPVVCAISFNMEAPPFRTLNCAPCEKEEAERHSSPVVRPYECLPTHGSIWLQFGKSHRRGHVPKTLAASNFHGWPGTPLTGPDSGSQPPISMDFGRFCICGDRLSLIVQCASLRRAQELSISRDRNGHDQCDSSGLF